MGNAATHHRARQALRRRLEAAGATPEQIEAAVAAKRRQQLATRRALDAEASAWRHRHPRLSDTTIRLVVAELRRQRHTDRGAA